MSTSVVMNTGATGRHLTTPEQVGHIRLRLTRRGRAVIVTLIAVPLALAGFFQVIGGGNAAASDTHSTASFHYITVNEGQTLWSIAENLAPQADPRQVISDIVTLNDLSSGVITPGERLAIPAQYEH